MNTLIAVVTLAAVGMTAHAVRSEQLGIKRTALLEHSLSITGRKVIQVRVDFPPGTEFPAHSHPGEEVAYVIEGSIEYQFEGQPPITLTAGQALFIPAGAVHAARNVAGQHAAELATYIVENGKPLVVVSQ